MPEHGFLWPVFFRIEPESIFTGKYGTEEICELLWIIFLIIWTCVLTRTSNIYEFDGIAQLYHCQYWSVTLFLFH